VKVKEDPPLTILADHVKQIRCSWGEGNETLLGSKEFMDLLDFKLLRKLPKEFGAGDSARIETFKELLQRHHLGHLIKREHLMALHLEYGKDLEESKLSHLFSLGAPNSRVNSVSLLKWFEGMLLSITKNEEIEQETFRLL